jgi:hypothetical protein
VVGGGWTLYTYFNARAAEARTATIEAKKPFLARRLEAYSNAVDISAKAARLMVDLRTEQQVLDLRKGGDRKGLAQHIKEDTIQFDTHSRRFSELLFGSMALVQDKSVEQAALALQDCFLNGCESPLRLSEQFAHMCRDSLGSEWQVNVSDSPLTKDDIEKLRH